MDLKEMACGHDSVASGYGSVRDCSDRSNELLVSINGEEFLDRLNGNAAPYSSICVSSFLERVGKHGPQMYVSSRKRRDQNTKALLL